MKKIKLTPEEEMKLDMLRDSIQRYENLLAWQKVRRAEKKMLELRLRYDYRSWLREHLLDKFLVTLRPKRRKDDG
jgi:phage-related protein